MTERNRVLGEHCACNATFKGTITTTSTHSNTNSDCVLSADAKLEPAEGLMVPFNTDRSFTRNESGAEGGGGAEDTHDVDDRMLIKHHQ